MTIARPPNLSRTVAYFLAFAVFGLGSASLGPTLSALADQTGSHLNNISSVFVSRSLGYLLGILISSRLFDRIPAHPLMALGIAVEAVVLATVPLCPSLATLAIAMVLMGVAEGTIEISGNSLLVRNHAVDLAPFMNGLHFFFGVGAFVAPLVVAQAIAITGGVAWAYWALAAVALPAGLWILTLASPATGTETGSSASNAPAATTPWTAVVLVAACFFAFVGAEAGLAGWIYTYAYEMNLASKTTAAYLTSAFWGAFTFGRLLAIPLSRRMEPQAMLVADICGAALSVGIILLLPGSVAVLWLGTLVAGLSMASMFATLLTLAQSRMPWSARISGWFFLGSSLGAMAVPWTIGQLFETLGARSTMIVLLADLGLALAVFAWLCRSLNRLTPLKT